MFKRILCPIDGSDHAHKALDLAIDLAKRYEAKLFILHVPHRSEDIEALQRFAGTEGLSKHVNTEMDRLRAMDFQASVASESAFREAGISPRLLIEVGQYIINEAKKHVEENDLHNAEFRLEGGNPPDRILQCIADEKIDCVIMGTRGLSAWKGLYLGSVSHKVANRAPCTCIAVK